MLDTLIYELNIEFIVYKPHNLPRADIALKHYYTFLAHHNRSEWGEVRS